MFRGARRLYRPPQGFRTERSVRREKLTLFQILQIVKRRELAAGSFFLVTTCDRRDNGSS